MATASNNTIELTRLPNPTKHEQHQVDTLDSSLAHHKDIDTYSKNVDINTFRTYSDSKQGFKDMVTGIGKITEIDLVAQTQRKELGKKLDKDPDNKDSTFTKINESWKLFFKQVSKPFKGLWDEFDEHATKLSLLNKGPLDTFHDGAAQFNRGLKEFSNGIGALGPAFNILKTTIFKIVAAWNMFMGVLRIFGAIVKGLFKFIGGTINAILHPIETLKAASAKLGEWMGSAKKAMLGWFGGGKEDSVEDAVKKDKEEEQSSDDRMVTLLEAIAEKLGAKTAAGKSWESIENELSAELLKLDEENAAIEAELRQEAHLDEMKKRKKEHQLRMAHIKKQAWMIMTRFITPFTLAVLGMILLWKKWDDWQPFAGVTAAIKSGAKHLVGRITGIFSGITATLKSKFPRMSKFFGIGADELDTDKPPTGTDADKKPDKKPDSKLKKVKDVAKTTGRTLVKFSGPIAGTVEAAVDANDQRKGFALLKDAYETGKEVGFEEDGVVTYRKITEEDWAKIQEAHNANLAGSVGKGVGASSAAGAMAWGASGLLLTPIPGARVLYAGLIIAAAVAGGKAGDKAATTIFEGEEEAQSYIDGLESRIRPNTGDNLKENVDEIKSQTQLNDPFGGAMNNTAIKVDANTISDTTVSSPVDMTDKGLEYASYPHFHAGRW